MSYLILLLAASLLFPTRKHDFGIVKQGRKLATVFMFKNTGNTELKIFSVSSSCSCTVSEYTHEVAPGKSGKIKVSFDTHGLTGITERKLIVISNTKEQYHALTITADIRK